MHAFAMSFDSRSRCASCRHRMPWRSSLIGLQNYIRLAALSISLTLEEGY